MKKFSIFSSALVVIIFTLLILFIQDRPNIVNKNINEDFLSGALKNIFKSENIHKVSNFIYEVDTKNYYTETIGDFDKDGVEELVIMEPMAESGKIYRFYRKGGDGFQLIGEEGSLIWYLEKEKNNEIELIFKDVTGDNIPEIFIPIEENAKGNKWYSLLRFSSETLKFDNILFKHYSENKPAKSISFDKVDYLDSRLVVDWHGTYERGKSYYRLENNIFIDSKTIGLFGQPRSDKYEYREIDESGNVTYREKRTGSIWTGPLERRKNKPQ